MEWTIMVVLLVLWGLGLITSYTLGGLIHLLILAAVIILAYKLLQGKRI